VSGRSKEIATWKTTKLACRIRRSLGDYALTRKRSGLVSMGKWAVRWDVPFIASIKIPRPLMSPLYLFFRMINPMEYGDLKGLHPESKEKIITRKPNKVIKEKVKQ
jgi:hypothetical protein